MVSLLLFEGIAAEPPAVAGAASATPAADPRQDAVTEAVRRVLPSVVNIATEEVVPQQTQWENLFREYFDPYYRHRQPNTQFSLGSGVVIDEEGFILTNLHVVNRGRRVWVNFADGRKYEAERVVGNTLSDLALVKISATNRETFVAVKLAADDDLILGETVLALGNPFGLGGSVSRGILSSKTRRPPADGSPLDVLDWLQTDASINPGNSGGPLVNLRGELIGVNVAVHREGQGIGFAIPVKRVSAAVAEIYSPEVLEKMWFGARIRPGAPLQVLSVQTESPAGKAGLRPGDVILELNKKAPRSFIDFNRELANARDGREVTIAFDRAGQRRTISLRLVAEDTFFNADLIRRKTGLATKELTPQSARELGLSRVNGLVITAVDRDSAAAAARLDRGMIVSAIDGQGAGDLVAVARTLYGKGRGDKVRLEVIIPRQRSVFIELSQTTVELVLR